MLNKMKILIKKILNLKLVTMLEFQIIKTFLLKDILQIGQKTFLLLVKLKTQFLGLMLLVTWMVKKLLEVFMKKNWKKLVKKNLERKNYLKEKVINCVSNKKGIIIVLIVGLIKKTLKEILLMIFKNESFKCNLLNESFKCNLLNEFWNSINEMF